MVTGYRFTEDEFVFLAYFYQCMTVPAWFLCEPEQIDPNAEEEVEPRFEGAVRLTDSENARYLDLMAGGEVLREYQKALDAFRKALRGFCHKRGVELIELTAGENASGEMLRRLMTAGSVQ